MGMYCISSYTILVGVTAAQTDTKQTLMLGVDGHLNKVRMHPETLTQYKCHRQKVYKQLLKYMGLLINKKVNTQSTYKLCNHFSTSDAFSTILDGQSEHEN